ncbi:MAG: hypothetical protein Q8784_01435 [Vigna little leaf phytoplasma]|nr:hypothetical protein [Vigna little leaf phytoplasma]
MKRWRIIQTVIISLSCSLICCRVKLLIILLPIGRGAHQIKCQTIYSFDGETNDAVYEYEQERANKKIQYQPDEKNH